MTVPFLEDLFFTHSETNFQVAVKTGLSISVFVHSLKLWLYCETLTVSKVLLTKCKTFETVNWGRGIEGVKMWELQKFSQL